jgi:regulator of sigma E protease
MIDIIYFILALLGLGVLIFVHELGHYIVARRNGMTVEAFSIGFGKPLYTWQVNGVKWQLCWLPFGGYVRIAGMEKKGGLEPYQIPDGFYGKSPWARIKVALAGPLVNVVFAFVAFTLIWMAGGQEKPFAQYTNVLGSVDPQSKIYSEGVRPGDEIVSVDHKSIRGFRDLALSILINEKPEEVQGLEINYWNGDKKPFAYKFDPEAKGIEAMQSLGIAPASAILFEKFSSPASPMQGSGIQQGDRILWVNGEFIFSFERLTQILNEPKTVLTIQRSGKTLLARVPRLKISDLRLDSTQKSELEDWQHEAGLKGKSSQLYFIPYNLTNSAAVESPISYVDQNAEEKTPQASYRDLFSSPLQPGDQIIAIDGTPITTSYDLLSKIQEKKALIILQRSKAQPLPSWEKADDLFINSFQPKDVMDMISAIGTDHVQNKNGDLLLLSPISLVSFADLPIDSKLHAVAVAQYEAEKKEIEKIQNPEQRENLLKLLEEQQKRFVLGIKTSWNAVSYNPNPVALTISVFDETWRTLVSLISGFISPKYLTGPVGIIQALEQSWANGIKDALFWLGLVSVNLAVLNLLPIPVLDGGHILFAVWEKITKKPIKSKTMERLIIPFVVLLVLFFIYVTYHDLSRLLHRFF